MSLPILLRPEWGRALVVGGGTVGARKVRGLVAAGFAVTVVAPVLRAELRDIDGVALIEREVVAADLDEAGLVYACTDRRAVNREVGRWARARGIPVLVADAPAEGTFLSPAVHRRDGLVVAVSTEGADPARAVRVRDRLARALEAGDP